MKDPELKFWTTKPNVFLVAINEETKRVVGIISYKEISPDTGRNNVLLHFLQNIKIKFDYFQSKCIEPQWIQVAEV